MTAEIKKCPHLYVAEDIFKRYDNFHDIQSAGLLPTTSAFDEDHRYSSLFEDSGDQCDMFEVVYEGTSYACIQTDSSPKYGIVGIKSSLFFCFSCKKNHCAHAQVMKSILNKDLSSYPQVATKLTDTYLKEVEPNTKNNMKKAKCLSHKKIKFLRDETLSGVLSDKLQSIPRSPNGVLNLQPDEVICACGSPLQMDDPVDKEWLAYENSNVITNSEILCANVYYRPCSQCDEVTVFEGKSAGLLNMGTYLVAHEVLRHYMHDFLHGRRPMYTFHSSWCDLHKDYGNHEIESVFSYEKFKNAWYAFLRLLDIDYLSGFSCPVCSPNGDSPRVIICDGTSLSFQRRMWKWNDDESSTKSLKISQTKFKIEFKDRVCLEEPSTRTLLKRFSRAKNTKVLLPLEYEEMKKKLKQELPSILPFIEDINDGTNVCPKSFRPLISSMASTSPVCSYLRVNSKVAGLLKDICSDINIKQDLTKLKLFNEEAPILYHIFKEETMVTENFKALLSDLWQLAIAPFETKNSNCMAEKDHAIKDEELSFFPGLPKLRNRGVYESDRTRTKNTCNKSYSGHPTLLPGIFTIYCPHGVCYGFQVMECHESPNIPFSIFRTRFKTAPEVIIYDNACALHQYCLNRDPHFFQETEFYVDRLHWDNHIGCSICYNLTFNEKWKYLNSQVNEQANAGLKRIKDQLSYMTAENFLSHTTFYLHNKNNLKLDTLRK